MQLVKFCKLIILAPILASSSLQGAVLIDQFNNTASGGTVDLLIQTLPSATPTTATFTGTGISGVLGGERRFTIVRTVATGAGDRRITASISTASPYFLQYSSSSGAGGYLELQYGVTTPLNFNMLGNSQFEIDFESYDLPGGQSLVVSLLLNSSAGSGTLVRSLTTDGGILTFEFSDPNYASVNFSDIDSITARFTAPRGADFNVNSITATAVPEPSVGLMSLAGAAFLISRRRRSC